VAAARPAENGTTQTAVAARTVAQMASAMISMTAATASWKAPSSAMTATSSTEMGKRINEFNHYM
jgi:hypothetical protein